MTALLKKKASRYVEGVGELNTGEMSLYTDIIKTQMHEHNKSEKDAITIAKATILKKREEIANTDHTAPEIKERYTGKLPEVGDTVTKGYINPRDPSRRFVEITGEVISKENGVCVVSSERSGLKFKLFGLTPDGEAGWNISEKAKDEHVSHSLNAKKIEESLVSQTEDLL